MPPTGDPLAGVERALIDASNLAYPAIGALPPLPRWRCRAARPDARPVLMPPTGDPLAGVERPLTDASNLAYALARPGTGRRPRRDPSAGSSGGSRPEARPEPR